MKIKINRVLIAILFMFAAYIFMQYHTYLNSMGLGAFGIEDLKPYPVRKVLHFLIFVIFTFILNASIRSEGLKTRILILLVTGLTFALGDEFRDYVSGFKASIGDVMIDFQGVLVSTIIIVGFRVKVKRMDTGGQYRKANIEKLR